MGIFSFYSRLLPKPFRHVKRFNSHAFDDLYLKHICSIGFRVQIEFNKRRNGFNVLGKYACLLRSTQPFQPFIFGVDKTEFRVIVLWMYRKYSNSIIGYH